MTEPERPDGNTSTDLRPVVARLREIHRKCLSLGSRTDESEEMAARLEAVIDQLSAADARPNLGAAAGALFPVARHFESLGFMGVARELAHVEKTLSDLDPSGSTGHVPDSDEPTSARIDESEAREPEADVDAAADHQPAPGSRRLPAPVAFGLVAVLVAVAAAVLIVRQQLNRHRTAPTAGPTPAVAVSPSPTVMAAVSPVPPIDGSDPAATPTPSARARLSSLIGEARLAQREGDIDRAISLLSQAALIESKAHTVISTARALVSDLLARADAAADDARWDEASELVGRARELAIRFELPTDPMDEATRRHARLERFERVDPEDTGRLAELTGLRALVITRNERRFEGFIHNVRSGMLELQQALEVGRGGSLFHIEEIDLDLVVEIRVYPD